MDWFIIGAGLFSFAGGLFGWDWFLNSRKARFLVKIIGPMGARIFYMVLGLGIATLGVLLLTGVIENKPV